jgi:hypothetical protein
VGAGLDPAVPPGLWTTRPAHSLTTQPNRATRTPWNQRTARSARQPCPTTRPSQPNPSRSTQQPGRWIRAKGSGSPQASNCRSGSSRSAPGRRLQRRAHGRPGTDVIKLEAITELVLASTLDLSFTPSPLAIALADEPKVSSLLWVRGHRSRPERRCGKTVMSHTRGGQASDQANTTAGSGAGRKDGQVPLRAPSAGPVSFWVTSLPPALVSDDASRNRWIQTHNQFSVAVDTTSPLDQLSGRLQAVTR